MNMKGFLIALSIAVVWSAHAQTLDGRTLRLEAKDHMSECLPVSLQIDGDVPEGTAIWVEQGATGHTFPAMIRNGEISFVAEGAMPGAKLSYTVRTSNEKKPEQVQVRAQEGKKAIDVYIHDKLFTTYHYTDGLKKPYLWPVLSEGETPVTRAWPIGEKEITQDHPHHKSLWTSYGNVNGVDCWAEGDNAGVQRADEVTFGSGDAYGWIRAKNTWQSVDGKPVISEEREYRFYATPESARILDVTVKFTADHGDVTFGDTKEGGIVSLRMRDALSERDGTGTITLSTGAKGMEQAWGKPAAWCDYSGTIEGIGKRGIAVFDNAANLRHPTRWHVRDYGLLGANCFGLSYFTEKDPERLNGDYVLKNGESLTFQYRLYVHSGDVDESNVADRYADYANPPAVSWAE